MIDHPSPSKKIRRNLFPFPFIVLIAACFLFSALRFLRAIEIPLEAGGKTTNIAYVNMHKIFEAFPETEQARADLTRVIEEKKADITAKKEEIAKLKGEVDFLRRQMSAVIPSTTPKNVQPEEPAEKKLQEQTTMQAPSPSSGLTSLTLPEGSPLGFIFSPPPKSTETPTETTALPGFKISTSAPSILPGIPSPEPQLKEKEALLSQKEADLEAYVGAAEEEVKQMEEGKTMTLLARIYKALEDIAGKQGYSVIIDKENILYGENAIDITQDVIIKLTLKKLK